jgi:uncharacterized protein (DUF1810 family)
VRRKERIVALGNESNPFGSEPLETGTDTYNLQRFINAQESTFEMARTELAAGQKRTHWMWFIFPQIRGLGSSPMAERFAISGLSEAAAYLEHPLLGRRLEDCTSLVNAIVDRPIDDIFGYPDNLKFYSSVTLFSKVASDFRFHAPAFHDALRKYFSNKPDQGTLQQLGHAE